MDRLDGPTRPRMRMSFATWLGATWLGIALVVGACAQSSPNPTWTQADAPGGQSASAPTPDPARSPTLAPPPSATPVPPASSQEMWLPPRTTGQWIQTTPQARPLPGAHPSVPRVALLLPLSGPNGALGQAMTNAAQLALFDFADQEFELLFHDTRGTPEGAAQAAAVALADGASLILGPLLAGSVRAVAPAAQASGVNVVAFSSDRTVAGGGVFTMGFLPSAEVGRVVRYAIERGLHTFAALVPNNDYGSAVLDAYYRAVESLGGQVIEARRFDPAAGDHTEVIKALANYDQRRHDLLRQIAELEAHDDELSRRALKRLETLQTIGDLPYEALLVADGGKRLQNIAALLPFYDIDPGKVRMLGTGQWDEAWLGTEPALVGGWFAAPPPEGRVDFIRAYQQAFGKAPPRLATLAYDATALAAVLARSEGGADFSAYALTAPGGFAGRDGIFRFLPEGVVERGLAVLQVQRDGARVISAPPTTFETSPYEQVPATTSDSPPFGREMVPPPATE